MKTAVVYLRVSTREQATRGNEAEGFSIPAQRDACRRKAESLGATVIEEFVDAGESARSVGRPALQRMLAHIAHNPTTYVIVHKVDRLARNRADDVQINLALQAAGCALVSVTENIDTTPSGLLLHGIMSSIAEFYSRNLANEVAKGARQKAKNGGTPTVAPIGYLNVRETIDGHEIRTVRTDPERAPHIVWAFEQYATGDWSLYNLADVLEARGLRQRSTAKRAARPLPANKLHNVLRNRYYLGYVSWEGVEYPGKHEPLIDTATFEHVQQVLSAHRQSGERSYRRQHYLAGSLYCGRCGAKLLYAISTGRHGGKYAYWFCGGRHNRKNGCDLPYMTDERVETAIVSLWAGTKIPASSLETIRAGLLDDLTAHDAQSSQERTLLQRRVADIKRERLKWAELAMDGTVPRDIARDKQTALASQLAQIEQQQTLLNSAAIDYATMIEKVLRIISQCATAYAQAPGNLRRDFNQAFFERIILDTSEKQPMASAKHTELFEIIETATVTDPGRHTGEESLRPRTYSTIKGSMVVSWVELRGLEPLTPTLPVWCATSCAIAPDVVLIEVTPRLPLVQNRWSGDLAAGLWTERAGRSVLRGRPWAGLGRKCPAQGGQEEDRPADHERPREREVLRDQADEQ